MRCFLFAGLITAQLASLPAALLGQATPTPTCTDSLGQSMAFLQGDWEGRSYSIAGADTTLDATMKVRSQPLFGLCALEERWQAVQNGRTLFSAAVVRSYDAPTQRWLVYYVDDQLNSQIYEGRWELGQWRFSRTRLDKEVPIVVRLTLGGFVVYRRSGQ